MNLQTLENLSPQPAEKKDLHINAIYEGMAENGGFLANGLENNPRNTALYSDIGKPSSAQIIAELARARCLFQLSAIRTAMGIAVPEEMK